MSEGARFFASMVALSVMAGFCFTVGMWAFCWAFNWAPVNVTNNTTIYEGGHDEEAETRSAA